MAFDGIVTAALAAELNTKLAGGRVAKIAQPEADAVVLTVKNGNFTGKVLLSANASLPLCHLTDRTWPNPATAPNFCMFLRKHVGNARVLSVTQPGLERVLVFTFEHRSELGDLEERRLILELMGKHSNLIFVDEENVILDAVKHVSAQVSSVREVLPGRPYFIPNTKDKKDPLTLTLEEAEGILAASPRPLPRTLVSTFTGIGNQIAEEVCARAGIDPDVPAGDLSPAGRTHAAHMFLRLLEDVKAAHFSPAILLRDGTPVEYGVLPFTVWEQLAASDESISVRPLASVSEMLESYYGEKNQADRSRQKTADLRKVVQTHLERARKKADLQEKQLKDTEGRDKYRVYGELLNAYGYGIEPGAKSAVLNNYYTGEDVTIPLDPTLTPTENAVRFFDRYAKQKRTFEAVTDQLAETKEQILHLESVAAALLLPLENEDLVQIRQELAEYGYLKKAASRGKKERVTSKPYHFVSSDGFDIYVGKNNYQNDELTFRTASGGDWWFHAKGRPGSHVILRTDGRDVPDRAFEEAGALAAYFSSARDSEKVEIDYAPKKEIKKPAGAKPGFVVYYTNYSLMARPAIDPCREVK